MRLLTIQENDIVLEEVTYSSIEFTPLRPPSSRRNNGNNEGTSLGNSTTPNNQSELQLKPSMAGSGEGGESFALPRPDPVVYLGAVMDATLKEDKIPGEIKPNGSITVPYPESALEDEIEGFVKLRFTITGGGIVEDVVVLEAEPRGIFELVAVASVNNWVFETNYIDGIPQPRIATQLIEFKLENLRDVGVFYDQGE